MKDDFFKGIDFNALEPAKGRLLISEPFLFDPNFKRTVVLLVEHNKEGSVGFILNKPVEVDINEAIENFPSFETEIHYGGPVGQGSLFYMHTLGKKLEESLPVMPGLQWGGNFEQLRLLIDTGQVKKEQLRFFIGYSGWSAGQLEDELKENSWIVSNCTVQQVMRANQQGFWKDALRGLGKKYELLSNFPEDPSLN